MASVGQSESTSSSPQNAEADEGQKVTADDEVKKQTEQAVQDGTGDSVEQRETVAAMSSADQDGQSSTSRSSAWSPLLADKLDPSLYDMSRREEVVSAYEELLMLLKKEENNETREIEDLKQMQLDGSVSILAHFENKNAQLVEQLKHTQEEERKLRIKFDDLSHKTEQAKKTVQASEHLSLPARTMEQEKASWKQFRELRSTTWKELESVIALRVAAQNQVMTIGAVSAELRKKQIHNRDYHGALEEISGDVFSFSFGEEYQRKVLHEVQEMQQARRVMRLRASKLRDVKAAIHEIQSRIASIVSLHWI